MINSVRNYSLINNYSKALSFRGFHDETYRVKSKNKMDHCIHETYFFRNIETLEFLRDYILKNFPKGTNIADFGCSNGEETYSLGVLLNKRNKDKKYKITGYDISERVLEVAQGGPFERKGGKSELPINIDWAYEKSDRKYLRGIFFECFDEIETKYLEYKPREGDKELIEEKIKNQKDLQKLLELKCFREIIKRRKTYAPGKAYLPKAEFVKGVFDFRLGDVNDIGQILKPDGKTGVIIFKNAWYHIMGSRHTNVIDELNIEGAEKIMKAAHKILPKNGLLVVGNLSSDHLYYPHQGRYLVQDGKRIRVCDDIPFHDLLRKSGFKPVFYEQIKDEYDNAKKKEVYLPSVWQKAT